MIPLRSLLSVTCVLLPCLVLSCGADPGSDVTTEEVEALQTRPGPLAIVVPAPPRPVFTTDRKQHLLYELVFQNTGTTAVKVTRAAVFGDDDRAPLVDYQGDVLGAVLIVIGDDGTGTVATGGQGVVFVDVAIAAADRPPRRLLNRLTSVDSAGGTQQISTFAIAVGDERPAIVGPPLRGADLIDLGGCCASDHTRALIAFPDGLFLAQRYAIDFVRVDVAAALAGGDPFAHGDPTQNESYLTFGNDVLAVTDGRIVDTRDGMPENVPNMPPPADLTTAAGNYVVEALDDHRFALYAHVQPGSLRVHPGDRVRRGDVLALVGNTGNSYMPHLHFHVMDRPSPLDANGLPYVFDQFQLEATVDLSADNPQPIFVPAPRTRRALLPMTGDLLNFR